MWHIIKSYGDKTRERKPDYEDFNIDIKFLDEQAAVNDYNDRKDEVCVLPKEQFSSPREIRSIEQAKGINDENRNWQ